MKKIAEVLIAYLAQWIERYLKNRDLIHRKIEKLIVEGERITITTKEKTQHIRVLPALGEATQALAPLSTHEHCALVTYQTKENFESLLQEWETYATFKRHCAVYFVNPFSKTEKLWVLYPWSHHAIVGEGSLKTGLQSIANMVEFTTLQELQKILAEESA